MMQLATKVSKALRYLGPIVDQPVIRFPYEFSLSSAFTLTAGQTGARLPDTDFQNSLEFPFEIHKVKFDQDESHTFRDWRVTIQDQIFSRDWQKSSTRVSGLVENNTGLWTLDWPWIIRPKGGGLTVTADNLDANNPITVDVTFIGALLIPRKGA